MDGGLIRLPEEEHFNAVRRSIILGEEDEIVPILQAELLHQALVRSGADVTFARLPHAYHSLESPDLGTTRPEAWIDTGQRALGFFQTHLREKPCDENPDGAPPDPPSLSEAEERME